MLQHFRVWAAFRLGVCALVLATIAALMLSSNVSDFNNARADHKPGHSKSGGGGGGGTPPPEPQFQYQFHWLDVPGWAASFSARQMNNHGEVVGIVRFVHPDGGDNSSHAAVNTLVASADGPDWRTVLLEDTLTEQDRDIWPRLQRADVINDQGVIGGFAEYRVDEVDPSRLIAVYYIYTPAVYDEQGEVLEPPTVRGLTPSIGQLEIGGLNESLELAGAHRLPSGERLAFRLQIPAQGPIVEDDEYLEDRLEYLGYLDASHNSAGVAGINAWGEVAGSSGTNPGTSRAFFYSDGQMHDLGVLGKRRGGLESSFGRNLNDWGDVVGNSDAGQQGFTTRNHAFLYRDGTLHDLGTLGGTQSSAVSINNHGQVVGRSRDANDIWQFFVYDDEIGMIKLEPLIVDLPEDLQDQFNAHLTMTINGEGQIMGNVLIEDPITKALDAHGFVLTPLKDE